MRLWLVEAGASGQRALIGQERVRKRRRQSRLRFDGFVDPKSAGAVREWRPAIAGARPAQPGRARFRASWRDSSPVRGSRPQALLFCHRSRMVGLYKRPDGESALDARIAGLTSRRAWEHAGAACCSGPALAEVEPGSFASQEDRLLARAAACGRLKGEIRPSGAIC